MSLYAAEVLVDNPVLYLRLGEASGTTAVDRTKNGNTGTYQSTPTLGATGALTGDTDKAVTLDGVAEYISVVDAASLDLGDTFTLECWLKRSATGTHVLFDKGANGYQLYLDASHLITFAKSAVQTLAQGSTAVSDTTTWHLIDATKAGATRKVYLDGVDVTTGGSNATVADTALALGIGANSGGGNYTAGTLDEVAIYPTALSAARVLAHYNAGKAKFHPHTATVLTLTPA